MTTPAEKIANKMASLTDRQAQEVYSALRLAVFDARRNKASHAANLSAVMIMTGDVVEARIGSDRFDALLDQIDAHAAQ